MTSPRDEPATYWCVQHRRQVRLDGDVIYHVRNKDACGGSWYLVRAERKVSREAAFYMLRRDADT